MNRIPIIGITMGDPCGVGPEIIMKLLVENKKIMESCHLIVFGDPGVLNHYNTSGIKLNELSDPSHISEGGDALHVLPISMLKREDYIPSRPNINTANAMAQYIVEATRMAMEKKIDAVVTCPISKKLLRDAGYEYEGHTQFISALTGANTPVMMLIGGNLRVALVTIHRALKEVPYLLDTDIIVNTIQITSESLKMFFNISNPKIGICALNPHGGEEGIMGDEEREIIKPATEKARDSGINAIGPFPADTIFWRAKSGEFDAVIAMYHDQGLIPIKLLHFNDAVNLTLGLPIIRTSVDHGTAYEIAGKGIARCDSLRSAILMAIEMVKNRKAYFDS